MVFFPQESDKKLGYSVTKRKDLSFNPYNEEFFLRPINSENFIVLEDKNFRVEIPLELDDIDLRSVDKSRVYTFKKGVQLPGTPKQFPKCKA